MLVIGRCLMANPKLMLLDEPSMGLAPLLVAEIFEIIKRINEEREVTILLVEQNARLALNIAHHGYVMESGRIVLDDTVEKLRENADVKEFYLGLTEVGKKELPGCEALQAPQALAGLTRPLLQIRYFSREPAGTDLIALPWTLRCLLNRSRPTLGQGGWAGRSFREWTSMNFGIHRFLMMVIWVAKRDR